MPPCERITGCSRIQYGCSLPQNSGANDCHQRNKFVHTFDEPPLVINIWDTVQVWSNQRLGYRSATVRAISGGRVLVRYFPLQDNPSTSWVPNSAVSVGIPNGSTKIARTKGQKRPRVRKSKKMSAKRNTEGYTTVSSPKALEENESFLSSAAPKLAQKPETTDDTKSRRSSRRCKVPVGFHEDDETLYRRQLRLALKVSLDDPIKPPNFGISSMTPIDSVPSASGLDSKDQETTELRQCDTADNTHRSKRKARNNTTQIDDNQHVGWIRHDPQAQSSTQNRVRKYTTARKSVVPQSRIQSQTVQKKVATSNTDRTKTKGIGSTLGRRNIPMRRAGGTITNSMKSELRATLCCSETDSSAGIDQFMDRARKNAIESKAAWLEYCTQKTQTSGLQDSTKI
eukprot:m.1014221 g.1014221  ORF g.1014221 m.1014221 type:complete len:399 (+) comp24069_c0_seq1:654-1850(+)